MGYGGDSAAILSNYTEVLKTFYLPAIREQLNHGTILSDILQVNTEDVAGKDASIEMHHGRTKGTGARKDGGAMPEADYQKHKVATVPCKYNYGRVTFSGPTIAATRDEKGSYARVIDNEITGVVRDLQKEVNRQYWGCGYGIVGRWRSTGSGTSYTLQKKYRANSAGGDAFGSTFGAKYLEENNGGVPVVLGSYSSGWPINVDDTDIDVSAIAESADYDTITCTDPTVTEAAGTYYIRPASSQTDDSGAAGVARFEMMGLRGMITDENPDDICITDGVGGSGAGLKVSDPLQGLDVDTYSWWKSNVDKHSAGRYLGQRALTLNLMQKMFDKVETKAGKDYGPDMILTTKSIRREYLDLMQTDRRNVNTMTLDGGWTALEYNGIPLTVDDDAIDGEMYFLTTKDIQKYRMSDYDWMDKDGSILARISGYDAYEAILFLYQELGCSRRNSHGVICDLSYTD